MKDWIVNLSRGLADMGLDFWSTRRRDHVAEGTSGNVSTAEASGSGDQIIAGPLDWDVPNTSIPPLPEHRPVAVLDFDGPPGSVPIKRGETVIGRHSEDDVRVRDVRISRHHARLTAEENRCEICNLTALRPEPNPMLVNGTRRDCAEVVDGDVISLGGVRFTFRTACEGL